MKNNKDILNEAFFKKSRLFMSKSNLEKMSKKLPQYEPLSPDKTTGTGFALDIGKNKLDYDTHEVRKRLTDVYGAVFGVNTVKSLADRSIKKFPIIISDDVEPETSITLKRLMEEQYAEYINLMISNQVLNMAEFSTGMEGNIALQALDRITGATDKASLGDIALGKSKLTIDDVAGKFPVFNLLREDKEFKSGDELIDNLLEDAVIFNNKEDAEEFANQLSGILEEMETEEMLNENVQHAASLSFMDGLDFKYLRYNGNETKERNINMNLALAARVSGYMGLAPLKYMLHRTNMVGVDNINSSKSIPSYMVVISSGVPLHRDFEINIDNVRRENRPIIRELTLDSSAEPGRYFKTKFNMMNEPTIRRVDGLIDLYAQNSLLTSNDIRSIMNNPHTPDYILQNEGINLELFDVPRNDQIRNKILEFNYRDGRLTGLYELSQEHNFRIYVVDGYNNNMLRLSQTSAYINKNPEEVYNELGIKYSLFNWRAFDSTQTVDNKTIRLDLETSKRYVSSPGSTVPAQQQSQSEEFRQTQAHSYPQRYQGDVITVDPDNEEQISSISNKNKDEYNSWLLANPDALTKQIDKNISELLKDKGNEAIKDKWIKAGFLLQANMISGSEYIDYLTYRLGIPVPAKVRTELVTKFRTAKVRLSGSPKTITKQQIEDIHSNRHLFSKNVELMMSVRTDQLLRISSRFALGGSSALIGMGVSAKLAASLPLLASVPILIPAALGVGGFLLGGSVYRGIKKGLAKIRDKFDLKSKYGVNRGIKGWERVEALIDELDKQRAEVIDRASAKDYLSKIMIGEVKDTKIQIGGPQSKEGMAGLNLEVPLDAYKRSMKDFESILQKPLRDEQEDKDLPMTREEIDKELERLEKQLDKIASQPKSVNADVDQGIEMFGYHHTEDEIKELIELIKQVEDDIQEEVKNDIDEDQEFVDNLIHEAIITTTIPMVTKYIHDPDKVSVVPTYGTRNIYAYGSTEYDRRENRDRKYNQPLVITVTFKERLSDGKFADNELTAVIGILGVVNRIPSEEMNYILKTSAEGTTLKGVLQGDGKPAELITDLFNVNKINKNIKNLPVSKDIWKDLEGISALAVANKMAGKKNDNVANAHIVFSIKEINDVRSEEGHDYIKNRKLVSQLMDRYSAFTVMIADDLTERVYIYDSPDKVSWDIVPYSALRGKEGGDQLVSALEKMKRLNI